jgi:polyisoprenoid-binding protein YceI
MATAVQPFAGTYELDTAHSTVQFGIRHQQIATFRASFVELKARLTTDDGTIALAGEARAGSVSISGAPEFREHVVRGADFFDADTHPVISFHSTRVDLKDDGTTEVAGELTIRGATRPITAYGSYEPPREDPSGNCRAGFELRATLDRRTWGMTWQMPLPDGRDALGWDVEITAQLELVKND